ncbi:hypothetical protein HDU86_006070 [Geranomyces michiganensis]|nr:hypothetical protein HDU86_006070 [Geranomyces michiganensis]
MTATTTTTTTTTTTAADEQRKSVKSLRVFNAPAPPAVDLAGKPIPHVQRWGFSTDVFTNDELRALPFPVLLTAAFIAFNSSAYARDLYTRLDESYSLFQINTIGTFAITTILYWAWAAVFAFVDLTGYPKFLFKYKVQPFARVNLRDYARIAVCVVKNQVLVALPLTIFAAKYFPSPVHPSMLQSAWAAVGHIIFNNICTEVGFYFIHRAFHSKLLYARYHKKHHMLTAPVGLGATYCGVAEHLLSNLLPNVIGIAILRPHWSIMVFTFCFIEIGTIVSHSGYNIPYLLSSLRHDWHHFAFTENYGPLGIFDNMFGTARKYDEVMAEGTARHAGDRDKAREELLSKLAAWEASQ